MNLRTLLREALTAARTSPRLPAAAETALPTPVGARYSPKTSRIAAPHSPVVTPAFAAATEKGIRLAPVRAPSLSASIAASTGARGVPFFFVRVDRAGNISKRQSATDFHFSRVGGSCPLWNVYEAFTQPGRVLTRDKLQQVLYGWDEDVESNALEVHIHHLRKKFFPELIRTVRGVGYLVDK